MPQTLRPQPHAPALSRALLVWACSAAVACGSSIPKPWSKREGQQTVVGSGPAEERTARRSEGEAGAPARSDGAQGSGIQAPQVQRVGPEVPDDLPPVEVRYDQVCATAHIETCPEGTTWKDERHDHNREFCALSNGVRHGPYVGLHPSGKIKECGPYVGGIREGYWSEWDRDGKIAGTWRWVGGSPTSGVVPE
jgi:hypothetical protein